MRPMHVRSYCIFAEHKLTVEAVFSETLPLILIIITHVVAIILWCLVRKTLSSVDHWLGTAEHQMHRFNE